MDTLSMTTRHLIDPELLVGLELIQSAPITSETLPDLRRTSIDPFRAAPPASSAEVTVEELRILGPVGAPAVRILLYQPRTRTQHKAGYLHIHGGGYIAGCPESSDPLNRAIAIETGCVVVSVDYRLAPETPHPGPVEDCYAALKWFHDSAGFLGVDADRIAVGGESAGGGLAAALALLARDRGTLPIVFQRLIYPMIDDRTALRDPPHPYTGEFGWGATSNAFGWESLLGQKPGGQEVSCYAAAARAKNLEGLPPTFISVGALDLFLDENIEYAQRLLSAGVPTELHIYPGAYHGFQWAFEADVTKRSMRDASQALHRALHR
jgi:acetyl esterase/lipase